MNSKRTVLVLVGVIAVLVVGVIGGAFAFHLGPWAETEASATEAPPVDLGAVIATVDGQAIYMLDAASRLEGLTTVHGGEAQPLGEDWQDRLLESLTNDQIIRIEAEERGITATQEDLQHWFDQIDEMMAEGQTLDDWLASQDLTLGELQRRIELQIIATKVYLAVTEGEKVSGREIREYYRDNPLEFQETDGSTTPLLEVRKSLRESLMKQKQELAYQDWLAQRRAEVDVVIVMDGWWKDLT